MPARIHPSGNATPILLARSRRGIKTEEEDVDDDKHCRIMESEYPGVTLAFLPDRTFPYRVTRLHDGKTVYTMEANLRYICAGLTGQTDWTASHDGGSCPFAILMAKSAWVMLR